MTAQELEELGIQCNETGQDATDLGEKVDTASILAEKAFSKFKDEIGDAKDELNILLNDLNIMQLRGELTEQEVSEKKIKILEEYYSKVRNLSEETTNSIKTNYGADARMVGPCFELKALSSRSWSGSSTALRGSSDSSFGFFLEPSSKMAP